MYDLYDINKKELPFNERWSSLLKIIPDKTRFIKVCEFKIVNNISELNKTHSDYVERGYEGLIIRKPDGKYEPDHRSSGLLKFKSFTDDEFEITDYKEGKGNDKGTVIFTCKTKDDNKFFEVRPRGTREERKKMFLDAESYIGKYLTVKYFELTDDGIPRFPVGLAVRDYE